MEQDISETQEVISDQFLHLDWIDEAEKTCGNKYRKDLLIFMAKLSKSCERYEEETECAYRMCKLLSSKNQEPNNEEMEKIEAGFYDKFAQLRKSWKILTSMREKKFKENRAFIEQFLNSYRDDLAQEIVNHCEKVVKFLTVELIPQVLTKERQVSALKLDGDYFRYLSEVFDGFTRHRLEKNALSIYQEATEIAKKLEPTSPARLAANFNMSVLLHERFNLPLQALEIAKNSFSAASQQLEKTKDTEYTQVYFLMMNIKEKVDVWEKELYGSSVFDLRG